MLLLAGWKGCSNSEIKDTTTSSAVIFSAALINLYSQINYTMAIKVEVEVLACQYHRLIFRLISGGECTQSLYPNKDNNPTLKANILHSKFYLHVRKHT